MEVSKFVREFDRVLCASYQSLEEPEAVEAIFVLLDSRGQNIARNECLSDIWVGLLHLTGYLVHFLFDMGESRHAEQLGNHSFCLRFQLFYVGILLSRLIYDKEGLDCRPIRGQMLGLSTLLVCFDLAH